MPGWYTYPFPSLVKVLLQSESFPYAGPALGGDGFSRGSLLGGAIGENWITHDEAFVSSELQTLALPSVSAERLTWTELAKGHVSSCCSICAHLT